MIVLLKEPAVAMRQDPGPGPESVGGGEVSWWVDLIERPGVVELALAVAGLLLAALVALRIVRLCREARRRGAVSDYLIGVEQALAGDLRRARKRLERVLAEDPENHFARLLFGKVLLECGEPAEAHKHHLYLQRAFEVRSHRNDLALARSLLAVGHLAEAVESAQRAVDADPSDVDALDLLFRVQLGAGLPEAAARTGQQLLPHLGDAERHAEVQRQSAAACGLAGSVRLRVGKLARARELLAAGRDLSANEPQVRVLAARLRAVETDGRSAARELIAEQADSEPSSSTLPVRLDRAGLPTLQVSAAAADGDQSPLPRGIHALSRLLPASRFRCSACRETLTAAISPCPHCGARDAATATEPRLFLCVESPTAWMDEIDENTAHVRRLLQTALSEGEARESAREELIALGPKAVAELLPLAERPADTDNVVAILREMGPEITPALFAAHGDVRDQRSPPLSKVFGSKPPTALIGRIVQGFGREALPHFESLLDSADRQQRKILIDYFIGLGDHDEFLRVLDRFPPLEILHRLNRAESGALVRFLAGARPKSFLAEGLLLDRAFYREEELVRAVADAAEPEVLIELLERRGPSRSAIRELILHLADDALKDVAERVLRSFGDEVIDHLLAAFTDLDRDADTRAAAGQLLAALGPRATDRVCACFGPAPSAIDDELVNVLQAMGPAAVEALGAAYSRVGMLERWTAGLVRRHDNRRVQIVRALTAIGTPSSKQVLKRLRQGERDANLKLRLAQALHRLEELGDAEPGGGHGQAG